MYKILVASVGSLLMVIGLIACAPVNSNNDLQSNSIDNFTTGRTTTILPSGQDKKKRQVEYVNSGDKDLFGSVKEASVSGKEENNPKINDNLKFRRSIKTSTLKFYKNKIETNEIRGSRLVLIVKTINNKKESIHEFVSKSKKLSEIKGRVTTESKLTISPFVASVKCKDADSCTRALITLTINKNILIANKTRDYDITAKIGITRRKAKVILKKDPKVQREQPSNIEAIIAESNDSEVSNVEKTDVVVSDGVSYSRVTIGNKVELNIPVTDPRGSDALIDTNKIKVEDSKVEEATLQGVSPSTGSLIVDVTTSDSVLNSEDTINSKAIPSTEMESAREKTNDRLIITTVEDLPLIEDGQISAEFNIKAVKALIESGEATWGDVGVNPKTSVFFKEIKDKALLKRVLTQEAEFEALRNNPKTLEHIDHYRNQTCKYFIKNIAPVRTIIAEAYLKSGLAPNFASNMKLETLYGLGQSENKEKNKRGIGKYEILVNPGCHTASGPFQINNGTYTSVLKRASKFSKGSGYAGVLVNEKGYEFTHHIAKVDFNPKGKGTAENPYFPNKNCREVNQEVFVDDHRMFLESGAILGSSFMAYNHSRFSQDAPLGFASYKQGPYRYYNEYKGGEKRFKGLTLIEIIHFNMTAAGIGQDMQNKYDDGIHYALRSIAVRSILTQPENYCSDTSAIQFDEDSLSQLYSDSLSKLKSSAFQKELNLLHPSGAILDYTMELTN